MNFDYQLSEKDERSFLKERHRKTNVIYFLLFSILYIAINIPVMLKQFWVFFTIVLFFIILLGIVLWICNLLFTQIELKIRQKGRTDYENYHFAITKRGITQSKNEFKKEVLWKDIKKIKIRNNYVFVEPKREGVAFIFHKQTLGDDYDKLIQVIKSNMKPS